MMSFPHIQSLLLASRKLDDNTAPDFLNPDYGKLHEPLLLPNISLALDRIMQGIKADQHIVVFSDYDADGIPGGVVLSDFFKRIKYSNVSFYIPHRHDEGFGLNNEAIDEIAKRGAKLLITVDCGISDAKEVEHANSLGLDVIITDHHEPGEVLPQAYAIIDPKLKESEYPFKELCGAALAYKLVQALMREFPEVKEGMEKWSLDMVGIATLSDMVPLVGENRILARFGLEVLRKTPRPGLVALFDKLSMSQKHLSEDDVTFMITPRINAASRMGHPMDAFKLLTSDSLIEAKNLSDHLEKINKERKTIVATIVKDAKKHLSQREIKSVIVIGNPEWKPSLLGLVANSLVEEYGKPVFIWGRDGADLLKGSCRTCDDIDLFYLMSAVSNEFVEFGGHKGAGGFSVTLEQLTTLEDKLSEAAEKLEKVKQKEEASHLEIKINEVSEDLWQVVSKFAPFGVGNEKPLFKISQVPISTVRQFGKTSEHLEIVLENGKSTVKAISFFSTPESYSILPTPGSSATLLGYLEKSYFRDRPELRLRIVDIQ
jgi:single-stranded-DNA-specific exonuclease